MKTGIKVLGAAGAVAGLWVGASVLSGQRVQAAMDAQVQSWQGNANSLLRLTNVSYSKRLTGATRTLNVELGCPTGDQKPLRITWRDEIEHGPFPGWRGFGAARIRSEWVLDADTQAKLNELKKGAEPFELVTYVGWNGSTDTQIRMPALAYQQQDMQFQFDGLTGRLQLDRAGHGRYEAVLPGYRVQDGKGADIVMKDVKFAGETLGPTWWVTTGKGNGSLKEMSFTGPNPADGSTRKWFALRDLQFSQTGSVENGLYTAQAEAHGKGEIAGLPLDALSVQYSLHRFRVAAYLDLITGALQDGCAGNPDPKARLATVEKSFAGLLSANPEFALDKLSVTVQGQTAHLHYRVGAQGVTDEEAKGGINPKLFQKLNVELGAEIPVPLIQTVLEKTGQALPPEALEAQINGAVERGFLERKGDRLSLAVQFKGGAATLNGKPLPIPGLTPPAMPHTDPH
ncbi:YdgA family protein [Inhella gelatinilytica]|uniref:YdgA family protein n=1 Tax=Inhella gelatinilytica TaxID=2795030 RepID=A0A931IZ40_9BURK|nr:YdgA family protein [Inhella gelatinilytica]MBH9553754.1 YdgA family protein [Inhella gelatinilytica]